ncbi:MAG TPA: alpha/beta fold hydrolase [Ktedonobacteraceae bacterium]|nr:alpha/beta fold hydrolase [Ktedonobacteraceae bacterium]
MKVTGKLLTAGLVVGGTLGALSVFNKITESQAGELDTVLKGEERRYPWKYGDVFYQVRGNREAKPLLLIHGFGPGASSFEWRKNVDALSEQYRVYALDLLGFGLSDRPSIDYSAETFTDLIGDFLREVIARPTVVVAHGLTCAYVVANAYRRPQLFERLVLVSPPTTILEESLPELLPGMLKYALRTPVIGQSLYNILTSRRAIEGYFDRQGYHNPGLITDELVEYIYSSAHQSNSRFPAASLLSGNLHMDVYEPLARLQMPVMAIWGREDISPASEASAAFKRVNPRIETRLFDNASQQLQDEQASRFNSLIREFAGATVSQ